MKLGTSLICIVNRLRSSLLLLRPTVSFWLTSYLFNDCRGEYVEEQEGKQCVSVCSEIYEVYRCVAIPLQPWRDYASFRLSEFLDFRHVEEVRMSAVRTGRLYPTVDTAGTHFC